MHKSLGGPSGPLPLVSPRETGGRAPKNPLIEMWLQAPHSLCAVQGFLDIPECTHHPDTRPRPLAIYFSGVVCPGLLVQMDPYTMWTVQLPSASVASPVSVRVGALPSVAPVLVHLCVRRIFFTNFSLDRLWVMSVFWPLGVFAHSSCRCTPGPRGR